MKTMKKTVSLVLSACLVLGTMSLSVQAHPTDDFEAKTSLLAPVKEVIFSENCDQPYPGIANGSKWGTEESTQQLTVVKNTVATSFNDNKLRVVPDGTGQENTLALKSDSVLTGNYVIEFKFRRRGNVAIPLLFGAGCQGEDGTITKAIELSVGSDALPYYADSNQTVKPLVNVTKKTDSSLPSGNENGYTYLTETLLPIWYLSYNQASSFNQEWYSVKVRVKTQTNSYDVYLNGSPWVKDAAFIAELSEGGINIPFMVKVPDNSFVLYDDIRVYREYTGRKTLYSNDFNSYSADRNWQRTSSGSIAYNIAGVAGLGLGTAAGKGNSISANGSGQITAEFSENRGGVYITGLVADKDLTMEMDFTASNNTDGSATTLFQFLTASLTDGKCISVDKDGFVYTAPLEYDPRRTKWGQIDITQSHKLTFHADFISTRYTLYIDDVLVVEDDSLVRKPENEHYFLSDDAFILCLGGDNKNYSLTGALSIDNLRLFNDERENILSDAAANFDSSYGQALIIDEPSLPQIPEGYSIEWTSSNPAAISINNTTATINRSNQAQEVTMTATVKDTSNEYSLTREFNVTVPALPTVSIEEYDSVNKTITATASNAPISAYVFAAVYKGTELVGVKMTPVNNAKTAVVDCSSLGQGSYSAKAMLLGDFLNLNPLCAAQNITFDIQPE